MDKKRVLVVDDEAGLTRLLKASLEITGSYEVQEAHSATECLATAKLFKPDIILLDIVMPDISGYDLAYSFKANELLSRVPIVFLTAVAYDRAGRGSVSAFDNIPYLMKPVSMKDVIACIEQQLQKTAQHKSA